MSDTYTTNAGLIKPLPGGSLNTWGTKLNTNNFDLIDQLIGGSGLFTIIGDTTLTMVDGDSTSTQLPFLHRFGGAPSASFAVTYAAVNCVKLIHNASGQTATPKVSTGFSLPDGCIAFAAYNSTYGDMTNVTPNFVGTGYTVSQNGHIANKAYVDTAIATLSGVSVTGLVLVTGSDTTANYLNSKITASGDASKSTTNPGAAEVIDIAVDARQTALAMSMVWSL